MKTIIVKPFTTERKAKAFDQLRHLFETVYPGENIHLYGNLHFMSFDIDALLVTNKNVIFYEFKLNTVKQNVVTPHERHPWLFNDDTEVFPGRSEATPTHQMRRKRNLLFRRLKHVQYIYGCVLFVNCCEVTNGKGFIDFFGICDMKHVLPTTRFVERISTNKDWDREAVLNFLDTRHTPTGYYLPEKRHCTPEAPAQAPAKTPAKAPAKTSLLVLWLKSIFSGAGRAAS